MVTLPYTTSDLEQAARRLAEINHNFENSIIRTYWFRDIAEREVRLIHVDTDTFAKPGVIRPFYFGASREGDEVTPPSAIALITPNEEGISPLPEGWGDWANATVWEWNP